MAQETETPEFVGQITSEYRDRMEDVVDEHYNEESVPHKAVD